MHDSSDRTMNWASAMVGGITLFATIYYIIRGRRTYLPPKETVEDFIERYEATAASDTGMSGVEQKIVQPEKQEAL